MAFDLMKTRLQAAWRSFNVKLKCALLLLALSMLLGCRLLTPTPTTTPTPDATLTPVMPVPQAMLTEVLQQLDNCRSENGIEASENSWSFFCRNSADTGYTVTMTKYAGEEAARTQFEAGRGENPLVCFNGYDSYEVASKNPYNKYIVQTRFGWLAGQWVITINASFDYGYFHYNVASFSEPLYTSGVSHGLFAASACPS
jgi:hypothetical protein